MLFESKRLSLVTLSLICSFSSALVAAPPGSKLVATVVDDIQNNAILSDLKGDYTDVTLNKFDGTLKLQTGKKRTLYISFDDRLDDGGGTVPATGMFRDVIFVVTGGLAVEPGKTIVPSTARIYVGNYQLWFNEGVFSDVDAGTLTGVDSDNDGEVDTWIFDVPAEMPVELREKSNTSQPSQHRGWFSMPCQIVFHAQ